MNPMDLAGRTVLVTGASSGIGRDCAVLFSQLNARLILAARNRERLDETRSMLQGSGHHVEVFDVAALDDIPPWVKRLASSHGPLHGIVHSAGVHEVAPLRMLNAARLDAILRVNLNAAILLATAFRQKGCHAAGASLVFISSVAGLRGHAGVAAYTASKAALLGVTKSVAVELAREDIRVNCVAPALVETSMADQLKTQSTATTEYPLGPGTPRDVANGIAFLLSDAARWITGTTLVIDGGYTAR
jgi:NAD(P)-dependent dehydrogenase (short-subunit alcohol dehydrogenase family)